MHFKKHSVRSCGVVGTFTEAERSPDRKNPSVKVPPVSMSMLKLITVPSLWTKPSIFQPFKVPAGRRCRAG